MNKEIEQQIIKQYQQDEKMMVLVFSQWCINHNLDPFEIYAQAYPTQRDNPLLTDTQKLTVTKEEAGHIEDETVLNMLSLYGNDAS